MLPLTWNPVGISIDRDTFCTEVSIMVNLSLGGQRILYWATHLSSLKLRSAKRVGLENFQYDWKFIHLLILKIFLCWLRKTLQTILDNLVFLSYGKWKCLIALFYQWQYSAHIISRFLQLQQPVQFIVHPHIFMRFSGMKYWFLVG